MEIFTTDIRQAALENTNFRKVLKTGLHSQLVLMSLKPSEDIGKEVHHVDQTLVFVQGEGIATLDGKDYEIKENSVFVVPAGTEHNFTNSDKSEMKLYTVYAPSEHKDGTVHVTKEDAIEAEKEENMN